MSLSRLVKEKDPSRPDSHPLIHLIESKAQRVFYAVFLPIGVVANISLGVVILSGLDPHGWDYMRWLQIGTGAFCCVVGGWLAAAAWSKSYWNRNMARQMAVWRRIADAFFVWLEDAPVPAEALHGLKSSLDEVVPSLKSR